jgi:S1-C subfamily serine protease
MRGVGGEDLVADTLQLWGAMLLFRSLALGLLGACFFLIATRPTTIVVRQAATPIDVPNLSGMRGLPAPRGPAVIDVAPNVDAAMLTSLVQLRADERVVAINDVRVANDLDAGRMLATLSLQPQRYIDLQIGGSGGERRILVLLH